MVSVVGSGGKDRDCADDESSSPTAFVSLRPTSRVCSCGSAGFGATASSAAPLSRASSAAEISLWMSISTRGCKSQTYRGHVHRMVFYLSNLRHVIWLIVQLLDNTVEARCDLQGSVLAHT